MPVQNQHVFTAFALNAMQCTPSHNEGILRQGGFLIAAVHASSTHATPSF